MKIVILHGMFSFCSCCKDDMVIPGKFLLCLYYHLCICKSVTCSPNSLNFYFLKIMEVNGQNFENITFVKALEILKNNTHLSITVKTNIFGE